ncbi:hypothetical protein QR680_015577 [Steinernema hermaphroditum]|uniref:G-protein coupled receptors family 1 profile domain-containing protein n=1 Tax=Steinernema hermaphroditum TaxID=289476 RepID=A0AA39HAU9_9BILA|nr:hypothetical protein QR680_015577 [Steinernema hermaphroditum]
MNETSDIVRDCENGFEPFRIFILANAVIAIPLSLLVLYLIIVKSPKHLNRYKYILLNIWVWVFVTDMLLEVIFVPIPLMDIFSFYATGLVQYLDPSVGFWCFVAGVFCVCESLISVLFAFFYRYRSLKHDFQLFGRPMIEKDIIQDTENEFEPFRIFILTNAVIALPLNLLVFYLIMFKSPKYLNKYKYILLNIWVWVFVTDMLLDVVVVPLPLMDIFSFYATGLVRYMDPSVGFGCYAFGVFCVSESLMSLLIAFFYRYRSLKYELQIFGKPVTMIHYCIGITFLLVVPPGTVGLGVVSTYVPSDHFQKYINKNRPDYMPFLEQRRVFVIEVLDNSDCIAYGTIITEDHDSHVKKPLQIYYRSFKNTSW